MSALFVRALTFVALPLTIVASQPAHVCAQPPVPRRLALALEPEIPTKIEALLATPNVVLVTDYYPIDMRFGPNVRVDAVVVHAVDLRTRLRGLRLQVRDKENRNRQEGTSFLDIEEITGLSRALTSMAELAAKWNGHDERHATELSFTSAGGFTLAIRESARVTRAYLSTGLTDPVITSIEVTELVTLKHAVDQALAILSSK
jgi:hypothetical protein